MPPKPAPWRPLFATHLSQSTSFTLSTITRDPKGKIVPRSRTCQLRGFWPTPSLHPSAVEALKSQGVGLNPDVYESDMLSLTTDIRMEKAGQIRASGAVEGMFWVGGVGNQWRVKGEAFVLGGVFGDGQWEEESRRGVLEGMRVVSSHDDGGGGGGGDGEGWEWERQVTAYFANLSPVMRGSFKNPPPGTPRSEEPGPGLDLGQTVDDLRDKIARRNFRVVVIRPEEVERLDLSDMQNVRRVRWTLDGEDWVETELWP
ncbi:hypothetical protein BDV25DRAFT_169834 [Aspergillus avenaceus]|uniref:Pyridoxamine 5'-phosphate oxidase Alr4036 family FMN-binding domain-containing protein n=1 Tax=Aspergillus avenaceus TaxID=36643 RepID=A0A5N6TJK8_ASPAV|nr:hypothetical protein BDV25DRAFT_169834 [Aspergillus avenaceus]